MDRSTLQAQLGLVDRGIAEANAEVSRMRKRIAELRRDRRDTGFAQEALALCLVTHSVLETRREIILIELEALVIA
jgi:hypothetical protein